MRTILGVRAPRGTDSHLCQGDNGGPLTEYQTGGTGDADLSVRAYSTYSGVSLTATTP